MLVLPKSCPVVLRAPIVPVTSMSLPAPAGCLPRLVVNHAEVSFAEPLLGLLPVARVSQEGRVLAIPLGALVPAAVASQVVTVADVPAFSPTVGATPVDVASQTV